VNTDGWTFRGAPTTPSSGSILEFERSSNSCSKNSNNIPHPYKMKSNEPMKPTKLKRTLATILLLAICKHPILAVQPGDAVSVQGLTKAKFLKCEKPRQ
jgi:hypothetical protein